MEIISRYSSQSSLYTSGSIVSSAYSPSHMFIAALLMVVATLLSGYLAAMASIMAKTKSAVRSEAL